MQAHLGIQQNLYCTNRLTKFPYKVDHTGWPQRDYLIELYCTLYCVNAPLQLLKAYLRYQKRLSDLSSRNTTPKTNNPCSIYHKTCEHARN